MRGNLGKVEVEIEYHPLRGQVVRKTRFLQLSQFEEGGFVAQVTEEPQGMFVLTEIDRSKGAVTLKEIDCDPIHWRGDGSGRGQGSDELCAQKCQYYNNCPVSVPLVMGADLD